MEQALPRNINLAEQKPNAVNSYIRRFRNIQTNSVGNNQENTEVIIPIDTGTPGAFLDCAQSYLQFDLAIYNANPYIDYVDFGYAGVNSVFETMSVRSNGTAIETIRDYATVFENWMRMEGIAQTEFEMYQSRKNSFSKGGLLQNELNSCKPPMIDMVGRIMHSTAAVINTNPPWTSTTASGPNCYGTQDTTIGKNTLSPWPNNAAASASDNFSSTVLRNYIVRPGYLATNMIDSTNINLWPQILGLEPNLEQLTDRSSIRFQDYMTYLANVKNVPVGCTTALTPSTTATFPGWTVANGQGAGLQKTGTTGTFLPGVFTGTFCVPLLSGLIGMMATKMAPTMLLDNFQLVMTLSRGGKAFKVSMDPCRRIPGTHRDFLTYHGNQLGAINMSYVGVATANCLLPCLLNTTGLAAGTLETVNTTTPLSGVTYGPTGLLVCGPLTGCSTGAADNITPNAINANNVAGNMNWQSAFFPEGSLVPQYYQSANCNNATTQSAYYSAVNNFNGNDGMGCYGTFLKSSVAQTARCIRNTGLSQAVDGITYMQSWPLENQGGVNDTMPKFTLSNIYFVAQQVIIPDPVTAQILASSVHGDISIQSTTIQVYTNINCIAGSGSQNIIIPSKVGSANTLLGIFRHPDQLDVSSKQFLVNSLSGICPIGGCKFTADSTSYLGTTVIPEVYYPPCASATGNNFSFQLQIGNDLVPSQAMTSGTELLTELEKCQHGLNARHNNMNFTSNIIPNPTSTATAGTPGYLVYDIFKHNTYFTTWVDPYFLNDQTIVNNMMHGLLGFNNPGSSITQPANARTDAEWVPVPVGPYMVNQFKHPDGGFILGFDLDTWSSFSDVAMSGRYLGNNSVSVRCEGLQALSKSDKAFNFTAIIMCDCRWSFQAGGNSQVFL